MIVRDVETPYFFYVINGLYTNDYLLVKHGLLLFLLSRN